MKSLKLTILLLFLSAVSMSQNGPFYMSYQAVVRDNNNQLVQNTQVGVRISILANGPQGDTAYAETHTVTTNINGLLDLAIGSGTQVYGSYAYRYIPWGDVNFYLKTEIDPTGGTNYTISSTSKMMSVPHSNYSHWSGALVGETAPYIGTYKSIIYDRLLCSITHVSLNRVMVTFNMAPLILIGEATPSKIIFPKQWIMTSDEYGIVCEYSGSITLSNNEITVLLTEECEGEQPWIQELKYIRF